MLEIVKDIPQHRMLTIVYGSDMVNVTFLNFLALQDDMASVTVKTNTPTINTKQTRLFLLLSCLVEVF